MNSLMPNGGKVSSPGASAAVAAAVAAATSVMLTTGTAAQQSNSKASTVELAIDYIKSLQGELQEVKEKLVLAERKLGNGHQEVKEGEKTAVDATDGAGGGMKTVTNGNGNGNGVGDGDGDAADGNDDG